MDQFTDRLSDYLDDELPADERATVESHVTGCPECTATLAELRRVVERARSIGPRPPDTDLWPAIAGRIRADGHGGSVAQFRRRELRRLSFTLPQLAAAAVLLIAISGVAGWQIAARARNQSRDPESVTTARIAPADGATTDRSSSDDLVRPVSLADAQYDAAVADLERALAKGRDRLDKATIAIVEENLGIIDQAISQARVALAADPANSYLSSHLVETRRKKLDLLRRAAALTTETD